MYSPLFVTECKRTIIKGGGEGERLRCSKFACKAQSSSSMSTKIWSWAAWMVMTVSKVWRMSKSFEVDGKGILAAVAPTGSVDALPEVVPIEEGGGAVPKGLTQGHLKLSLIWAALCLRKVAPMGEIMCTSSEVGKSSKPKNNKILWMKTRWKRAWAVEELLWTSFKEWRNRWGKLIGESITRVYKNAHRSKGMVYRWKIGQKEWHAILKKS